MDFPQYSMQRRLVNNPADEERRAVFLDVMLSPPN